MTEEEKALVLAFAGPLTAEMSKIENGTFDDQGYKFNNGQPSVKDQLARTLQRDFGGQARPPEPQFNGMFMPPDIADIDPALFMPPELQFVNAPQQVPQYAPQSLPSGNQLEFQFDQKEQARTNDLLESILKKLTRIITLLESPKEEKVVKLKV